MKEVVDMKDLLEDIVNEFGHKEQVLLSMDRIRELWDLAKTAELNLRPYDR
jgi:hypothetical protein